MKILKDNYNVSNSIKETIDWSYPRECECEGCGSVLEYEKEDLRIGYLGCCHLKCPLCGEENMIENAENSITLTADNVEFPTHFHLTSIETGAVDCCDNKRIKEYIQKGIDFLRMRPDEYDWFIEAGNLHLDIHKWEGDGIYKITATNHYYSTEIPFESKDYSCYAD